MCIIMRWSRNLSASWAERFRTSSLLCTYKICDYYSPIPIFSPFLFTPSIYVAILNLQDFSFTCYIVHVDLSLCTVPAVVPPLTVSFIGDSPRVQEDSVEADILLSRPVQSLICRLKGGSLTTEQDCEYQSIDRRMARVRSHA